MSTPREQQFADFERRRAQQRKWFYARRPRRIDHVIAQLVQKKGYAAVQAATAREQAWQTALEETGLQAATMTRPGSLRRGVLEILVANSLVMQELTFEKERLLTRLQELQPEARGSSQRNLVEMRMEWAFPAQIGQHWAYLFSL